MVIGLISLALLNIVIGLTIYFIQRKNPVQITYLTLSLVYSIWLIILGFSLMPNNFLTSILMDKLFYSWSIVLSLALLVFSIAFPISKIYSKLTWSLMTWVLLALSLSIAIILLDSSEAQIIFDSILFQFGIVFITATSTALSILSWSIKQRRIKDIRLKIQLQIILAMIAIILTLVLFLLVDQRFKGSGSFIVFVLTLLSSGTMTFLGYAVANQTVYDLRSSMVNLIVRVLELFMGLSLYLTLVVWLSDLRVIDSIWFSLIDGLLMMMVVGVLSVIDKPLFACLQNFFYKDQPIGVFDERVYQVGTLELSLKEAMRRLLRIIADHTGASKVVLILRDSDTSDLTIETLADQKNRIKLISMSKKDTKILDRFLVNSGSLVVSIQDLKSQNQELYLMFLSYGIDLLIPLSSGSTTHGYIVLANSNFGRFNLADIELLTSARSAILVDLLSAQARDKLAEINSSLEQKIKASTRELEWSNKQLRKLDEVKDEFVAMTSHQLRTPLTSIKGYLSLVLEGDIGKITKDQRQALTEAFRASEKMAYTINDFLNVSRLQAGRFVINKDIVDLKQIVSEEVKSISETAKSYDLTLTLSANDQMPVKMNVDENKLRQVINNLLDNAIFYSRPGGKVQAELKFDQNQIWFSVQDEGIGVPVDEQKRLFSKFYRASNGKKRRPDGTGIGLYLVKEIIEAHKGQVFYEPAKDHGSVFGFKLPVDKKLNPGIFVKIV